MLSEDVKLVSMTPDAEKIMAYCARVSNPENQENPQIEKLLSYCAKHGHWSVFEQANMVLEVQTSRAIAPQILRHRSFSFQEFSQRYSQANDFVLTRARRQDLKNKQNSMDDLPDDTQKDFEQMQKDIWNYAFLKYSQALEKGIAKECARSLLPLNTTTKIYMNGTIRSWIHYIELRTQVSTQLEHRRIAQKCQEIFVKQLPVVSKALGWAEEH
jgi:thymidylate synthase (FAD)